MIESVLYPYVLFVISFRNLLFAIRSSQSLSLKKLRGRSADRRNCLVSTPRKAHVTTRSAPGARARIRARTPTVAPPRLLHRRTNATAQPQAALRGTRLKDGCYPSPPVPVEAYSATPLADGALLIRLPCSGTPCPGLMPVIGVLFLRIQGREKNRPVRGGPVIEDKTDRSGKNGQRDTATPPRPTAVEKYDGMSRVDSRISAPARAGRRRSYSFTSAGDGVIISARAARAVDFCR
jgi:hypothetical protein